MHTPSHPPPERTAASLDLVIPPPSRGGELARSAAEASAPPASRYPSAAAALAAWQSEPRLLRKSRSAAFSSRSGGVAYSYAPLCDVLDLGRTIGPYELSIRHHVAMDTGGLYVECILEHVSGDSLSSGRIMALSSGSSLQSAMQSMKSAITSARRITAQIVLGIADAEDDDGATAGPGISDTAQSSAPPPPTSPEPQSQPPPPPTTLASAPPTSPGDMLADRAAVQQIVEQVAALADTQRDGLIVAFSEAFGLPAGASVQRAIKQQKHIDWLRSALSSISTTS